MITLPTLVLGLIISTLLGALFHLWRDGGPGKLILYLVLGWLGFWFGQFLAVRFGIAFASVGNLHLGMALLCGIIFLLIGHWLSLVEPENRPKRSNRK
ncbi:MAG: hypothetical protein B6D39_00285 [Anaerolineae bacterium UTCFX2]|nr:MAG: hypothetical protein B6D39_00285 [Anaerolineae bacterium UTCFX2]